jgi:hypothetical protein
MAGFASAINSLHRSAERYGREHRSSTYVKDVHTPLTYIAVPGRGKRGGARAIYYYIASASRIILLLAYPQDVQDTLTADQKNALRFIIQYWK